jgi:hypothetical protein
MTIVAEKEKLLCFMLLDDGFAKQISVAADDAFWRGFIVQDRATGLVSMKFRFKYKNGNRNWYNVNPKHQHGQETVELLRNSLEDVLCEALKIHGLSSEQVRNAVQCFYPPDDGGDFMATATWLAERDLVEISVADGEAN